MKLLITSAILLFTLTLSAQETTKLSFKLQQKVNKESGRSEPISVLIKGDINYLREEIQRMGGRVKFTAGDICSAIVSGDMLFHLRNNPRVIRIEEGHIQMQEMNDKMLINNKINLIHAGNSPLLQGYDGEDVIVGTIDTGIDFTHPDFLDSTGQSRVLWVWDHLLPVNGNTPQPYNYGQQFSKANIDAGTASAHVDATAHGTHVTGIAAANGDSLPAFKGAAPKADIIAVSLNFNQDDDNWLSSVADAVEYIFQKADSLGKPCVINISAGTYFGSHDGTDLQAVAIDNLIKAKPGRMVVAAAGNAGNYPLHLQHNLNNDTAFTWFSTTGNNPIYIEFWADTADLNQVQFCLGADKTTPAYENRGQLNWSVISNHLGLLKNDTLRSLSGNRIAIVQTYGQLIGDHYSMIYYVIPDSGAYYFRLMTKGTGKMDCWSFNMISAGLPAPAAYPAIVNYVTPDYEQNICSSFQCSDVVISTGQYVNRNNYIDVNGNLQTFPTTEGNIAASSSRGPTRDGRIKPDITSTGEQTLASCKLSSVAWFLANQPFKLALGGLHIRDGGTSSAAPAIAGAIALYLQSNPTADWQDIRNRVLYCATQDNFTGSNLPNNTYGHGKFDAFAMMTGCTALGSAEINDRSILLYPNPATEHLIISLEENTTDLDITITSITGQEIYRGQLKSGQTRYQLNTQQFQQGMYFVTMTGTGKSPLIARFTIHR